LLLKRKQAEEHELKFPPLPAYERFRLIQIKLANEQAGSECLGAIPPYLWHPEAAASLSA